MRLYLTYFAYPFLKRVWSFGYMFAESYERSDNGRLARAELSEDFFEDDSEDFLTLFGHCSQIRNGRTLPFGWDLTGAYNNARETWADIVRRGSLPVATSLPSTYGFPIYLCTASFLDPEEPHLHNSTRFDDYADNWVDFEYSPFDVYNVDGELMDC